MVKRIAWLFLLFLNLPGIAIARAETLSQKDSLKQGIDSIIEEVAGRDNHGVRTLGPNG